ncbi:hypothetical protein U0N67_001895 [Vibrio parahaemolyticus]|nr:hypothetical protein [Vibrio parahaemolyticus]EJL3956263.1 hypothetical protein [Vibrio parahaemolyticus]ELZ7198084.1 hypothetical protein [Vibrio parahaemolyticus]MBE3819272.1 hypothetical protein [Vibrio parahaemolyticus]MBM5117763.1 hypothetical protein [Vibrio parahaemolyticus]
MPCYQKVLNDAVSGNVNWESNCILEVVFRTNKYVTVVCQVSDWFVA